MVINQFPIMQLNETRVSNKNTRGHFAEPPHLPHRHLLISPNIFGDLREPDVAVLSVVLTYAYSHSYQRRDVS